MTIAITPGEPAGIGPDITLAVAAAGHDARLVAIADPDMLAARAKQLDLAVELVEYRKNSGASAPGTLAVLPVPLAEAATPGLLNPANAQYVIDTLQRAVDGCLSGEFAALVTGPVQKSVINDGGIPFSGHTEFLAAATGTARVVMMLANPRLRVALATTHLPLRAVADAITRELLLESLDILHRDLQGKFGLSRPRIAVLGLNPHAGEGGHLGREELDIIIPALETLRGQGMDLVGPLPADTAFNPAQLAGCDAVLAMYHDQGLPVLKHDGFGETVNITLGLPIIRTSVDHGTALELAGTGRADAASLQAALSAAVEMGAARN